MTIFPSVLPSTLIIIQGFPFIFTEQACSRIEQAIQGWGGGLGGFAPPENFWNLDAKSCILRHIWCENEPLKIMKMAFF